MRWAASDGRARDHTAQGDTAQGDTAQGHTARGDTAQGDTAQGDTAQGDTAQGDTAREALRVALFVPCYVDQLFPDVAQASLELLEAQGLQVDVAEAPSCCGQPLINVGLAEASRPVARAFERELSGYDHVVCPSGSCVASLRRQGVELASGGALSRAIELTEFLTRVLGLESLPGTFPHRVGVHPSCHALRELGQGCASETSPDAGVSPTESPMLRLLGGLGGIELIEPERRDECCGFGGSFSVKEPDVSRAMGLDRARSFQQAGAQVVTSADMSCLMHLGGIIEREGLSLSVMHVAQILAGRPPPDGSGGSV